MEIFQKRSKVLPKQIFLFLNLTLQKLQPHYLSLYNISAYPAPNLYFFLKYIYFFNKNIFHLLKSHICTIYPRSMHNILILILMRGINVFLLAKVPFNVKLSLIKLCFLFLINTPNVARAVLKQFCYLFLIQRLSKTSVTITRHISKNGKLVTLSSSISSICLI